MITDYNYPRSDRFSPLYYNIGIKHVFLCTNIFQVPRELLKMEAEAQGFQKPPRNVADVNALKIHN